jgi:hypothetical protein
VQRRQVLRVAGGVRRVGDDAQDGALQRRALEQAAPHQLQVAGCIHAGSYGGARQQHALVGQQQREAAGDLDGAHRRHGDGGEHSEVSEGAGQTVRSVPSSSHLISPPPTHSLFWPGAAIRPPVPTTATSGSALRPAPRSERPRFRIRALAPGPNTAISGSALQPAPRSRHRSFALRPSRAFGYEKNKVHGDPVANFRLSLTRGVLGKGDRV